MGVYKLSRSCIITWMEDIQIVISNEWKQLGAQPPRPPTSLVDELQMLLRELHHRLNKLGREEVTVDLSR